MMKVKILKLDLSKSLKIKKYSFWLYFLKFILQLNICKLNNYSYSKLKISKGFQFLKGLIFKKNNSEFDFLKVFVCIFFYLIVLSEVNPDFDSFNLKFFRKRYVYICEVLPCSPISTSWLITSNAPYLNS